MTKYETVNDMDVEYEHLLVDVLDTTGQEAFMSMMDAWIRSSDFFMLLFDTEEDAYKSCIEIIDQVRINKEDEFNGMFVATNRDLVN
eukprot:87388_1